MISGSIGSYNMGVMQMELFFNNVVRVFLVVIFFWVFVFLIFAFYLVSVEFRMVVYNI